MESVIFACVFIALVLAIATWFNTFFIFDEVLELKKLIRKLK